MYDGKRFKRYIEVMENSADAILPVWYHRAYNKAAAQIDDRRTDPEYLILRERFNQAVRLGKEKGIL